MSEKIICGVKFIKEFYHVIKTNSKNPELLRHQFNESFNIEIPPPEGRPIVFTTKDRLITIGKLRRDIGELTPFGDEIIEVLWADFSETNYFIGFIDYNEDVIPDFKKWLGL